MFLLDSLPCRFSAELLDIPSNTNILHMRINLPIRKEDFNTRLKGKPIK
jgi:hypothetical protein